MTKNYNDIESYSEIEEPIVDQVVNEEQSSEESIKEETPSEDFSEVVIDGVITRQIDPNVATT